MRTVSKRLILVALLASMLTVPLIARYLNDERHPATPVDTEAALSAYGFYLQEVSAGAGVTFMHQPPRLDARLDHIMPQIASLGASVSVVDFDRDGLQDFYVTNSAAGSANALYRNLGDGTFADVAPEMGLAELNNLETGVSMGAVWGDYDNDGYEDLFLYKWGSPELFHNDGGQGFTCVSEIAGLPRWLNANSAIWLDYDRDGALDLFVGGYYPENLNLWQLESTRMMPESFEYAQNGGRNFLFHNVGEDKFEEVAEPMGLTSRRWTLAAAAGDLQNDGYPDLVLANDYGVEEVYFNEAGQRFVEAGEETRIGFAPKSGMNVSFGDVMNQGRVAIYVSNISEPGVLIQGNNLWMAANNQSSQYHNLASGFGIELGGWSYGAQFGDLNNDGNLDLYLVNGYVSDTPDTDYWYDLSKVAGGNKSIISDAKNWPAMEGRSLSGYQATRVWLNDGYGEFNDVASAVGSGDTHDGRAVALVDLWNRGVLDVIVANQKGPLLIYKNTVDSGREWIGFALEGKTSNRSAIGAKVSLHWNGRQQVQEVSGGSGFAAQNQRPLHFGLGPAPQVDKAIIHWPSGAVQELDAPQPGRIHRIVEPD